VRDTLVLPLVSEAGEIIWNHEGDLAKEPSGSLPIAVEQGFYAIELGNPGINGMSDIPDGIFEDNPRSKPSDLV
jgi:hypothetical protein